MKRILIVDDEQNIREGRPRRKGSNISREVGDAQWREKLCVYMRCPYRKPTQVDEERILRPTGEGLLRNSAN